MNVRSLRKRLLPESRERMMNTDNKEKYLKMALRLFGVVFLLVYPLSIVWPSGWVWHGGEGVYYFQMIVGVYAVLGIFLIMAANKPSENRSLISFTVWSSVVHALIMAVQAFGDQSEHGHLVGDVPALLLVAAVLGYLAPRKSSSS
jgi:FtsH-binding integral membrane protein